MVTLVLVRHAKSDWGDAALSDHDRPLNLRGLRDAPAMAQEFASAGGRVDRILTSTATRARTTASEFATALGVTGKDFELDADLYASSPDTMIEKAEASGATSVMIVAHNPGITELAERLSGGGITHMPTCAVAVFYWQADDWAGVIWDEVSQWALEAPARGPR